MMSHKAKNIGELFRESFEDFEVKGDSSDWSKLDMKLKKVNFFRLDPTCFNIYYASLIFLTFLCSSLILINILVSPDDYKVIEHKEKSPDLQKNIPVDDSSTNIFSKSDTKKTNEQKGKSNDATGSGNSNENSIMVFSPSTILTDSIPEDTIQVTKASVVDKEPKEESQKKIIYITKQDTLIVVDSIKTKKNRRKK